MINLTEIHQFQEPFVSAASGMVSTEDYFYIIADDELSLLQILKKDLSGKTFPLFPGSLPENKKDRKEQKPDLESLALTEKGLLAIPSGSNKNRTRGAFIPLNSGKISGPAELVDFTDLYQQLTLQFEELNIEGAIATPKKLMLFQRGNGKHHQNAIIEVDLSLKNILNIHHIQLGKFQDIPLSFTDATFYQGKIYFLAVAEDSEDTYEDGKVHGSVLGILNDHGEIEKTFILNCKSKPEGISIADHYIYVVTDDDDRTRPSKLLRAPLIDLIQ